MIKKKKKRIIFAKKEAHIQLGIKKLVKRVQQVEK
jgi:hypothetical protein